MIKKLLTASLFALSFGFIDAQTDLTSHFAWALATNPPKVSYYFSPGAGYVSGTLSAGGASSTSIVQLFDSQTGVTGGGTISSIKVLIAKKSGSTGAFNLKVWANNNGAIGAELGSVAFTLADVDTNQTAFQPIMAGAAITGIYNVVANFPTPVSFPATGFWAGFTVPTTAAAGDTIVGLTTINEQASYPLATTHSGLTIGTTFYPYGAAPFNLYAANAIFATVNFSGPATGLTTLGADSYNYLVYPNPSNDVVNFRVVNEKASTIVVFDLTGKIVNTMKINSMNTQMDVTSFNSGIYFYQMKSQDGGVLHSGKFNVSK